MIQGSGTIKKSTEHQWDTITNLNLRQGMHRSLESEQFIPLIGN